MFCPPWKQAVNSFPKWRVAIARARYERGRALHWGKLVDTLLPRRTKQAEYLFLTYLIFSLPQIHHLPVLWHCPSWVIWAKIFILASLNSQIFLSFSRGSRFESQEGHKKLIWYFYHQKFLFGLYNYFYYATIFLMLKFIPFLLS